MYLGNYSGVKGWGSPDFHPFMQQQGAYTIIFTNHIYLKLFFINKNVSLTSLNGLNSEPVVQTQIAIAYSGVWISN